MARRVADARWSTVELGGRRTADPILTLTTLAAVLELVDLIAVADAMRSTAAHYPGIWTSARPMADAEALAGALASVGAIAGVSKLRTAVGSSRDGVESPRETLLRWTLVARGGFPEPEINARVHGADGTYLGKFDLAYRGARLAIEYEGDHHRTDREQWRRDIRRVERFAAHGWRTMRVTDDDLGPHADAFIARVGAHLARRIDAA